MKISTSRLVYFFLQGFIITFPLKLLLFKALYIYVATCIALTILLLLIARRPLVVTRSFLLAGGLYLIPLLSLITTSYVDVTRGALMALSLNIGLAFLASYNRNQEELPRLISILACSFSIVIFLISIVIFSTYGSLRPMGRQMADTVGSFSNHAAAIAILTLPYLFWADKYRLINKIVVRFAITASILIALLSLSRAAFILVLMVLILMQLSLSRRIGGAILKVAFICFGILLLNFVSYLIWGDSSLIAQITSRFQDSQILSFGISPPDRDLNDYGRAAMYFEGYQMFLEYWPLGSGFGGLAPYMEEKLGFGYVSHNIVITAAGELGLVGAIGYFFIFSAITIRLWRLKKSSSELISDLAKSSLVFTFVFFIYSLLRPFGGVYIFPIIMGLVLQIPVGYASKTHVSSFRDFHGVMKDA